MRKVFLRYFLSILAIAVTILVIQYGVLFVQYDVSQKQWMNNVYNDFVTYIENNIRNGSFADYGINGILRTVSQQLDDDRISGFIVRSADGSEVMTFGKTGSGKMLTSFLPQNQRNPSDDNVTKKVSKATRINLEIKLDFFNRVTSVTIKDVSATSNVEISLPASFRDEDVIGSVILAADGEDAVILDLLTYNPRTYEYSKDIINSCLKGLMISLPVCLALALIAAWIISSRNAKYINGVRKALNDLSHGKPGVTIPHQKNSELNEITVAIEELDKDLQANAKSRKAWLNSISHDLNTPTTAMKMIIDGLNDGVFQADSETLSELQKENDTLAERIGKVIDFSTLQADAEPALENLDAARFMSDVLEVFEGSQAVESSAECAAVRCDNALMSRAVTELLKNAVEARGEDAEPVRWTLRETDDSYEMVISNRGHIENDMDNDFFEPWTRGDWSRTSGGSGLGLPIVATIMYLHNGSISLKQADEDHVEAVARWPKEDPKA
ncbi:MAG: HAMP domain-containing histidine kinase [Spirochaetales bacterium]|nr:HAMP domain-containing histidine kinase [Spirochaetales bacterium]